jgi:hypothetical protein
MSTQYPGGFITKSPVAPTSAAASGIWTVDQALQYVKAGTWPSPPVFIEDMFSTYLYTGTGATQNITNNIDVSGKGGLVWIKSRNYADLNILCDTAAGANKRLSSDNTNGTQPTTGALTAFNSNGFSLGTDASGIVNGNGFLYASWTFAEQPKFFDIVTYTGTGANRTIAHNLGSVPGCIFVKRTDTSANWAVYHRSLANTQYMVLNSTAAVATAGTRWNSTTPTSTVFSVGTDATVNASGGTYVAYLFAHDAGGFPASGAGSTNGISCGSFTTDGSGNATVSLGYEPQWILYKKTSSGAEDWYMFDNMRGLPVGSADAQLNPNLSSAEASSFNYIDISATGFNALNQSSSATYIYIAIRRGPMKTPTVGTSVFAPVTYTGNGATQTITTNIVPSLTVIKDRSVARDNFWTDMLRGKSLQLRSNTTGAEAFDGTVTPNNTGFSLAANNGFNNSAETFVSWSFLRAPGFFDEVCYTGTGSVTTQTHNLGVAPELMIIKSRSGSGVNYAWPVYAAPRGATQGAYLNSIDEFAVGYGTPFWNDTAPTASVFTLGTTQQLNGSGSTYVAYLFATVAGVSKVGSYTGTGALQTVNCGFTTGARFVLIKRTDSTGDWFVWDSARGISSGNDPYLRWNSDAVEVTGTNYVDTTSVGFQVTAAAPVALNASGGTYIFLAIA